MYESRNSAALVRKLEDVFPGYRLVEQPEARYAALPAAGEIPVWHFGPDSDGPEMKAAEMLHELIYPVAVNCSRFVIAFEFEQGQLDAQPLAVRDRSLLDREDLRRALAPRDILEASFDDLDLLASRKPLTPIEEALAEAFGRLDIPARTQVRVGPYHVDFLIERNGVRVAVEADGRPYHTTPEDIRHDAERDAALRADGLAEVIRFTGSEIFRDADACAQEVLTQFENRFRNRTRRHSLRRESLDNAQTRAVSHRAGPACVLAPAGAGKTRVLVERIAELLERGVEPSSILALAFNKKAVAQLVERLGEIGIPTSGRLFDDEMPGVRCATFNAFGFRYQRERLGWRHEVEQGALWRNLMGTAASRAGVRLAGALKGSDPVRQMLRARERVLADLQDPHDVEIELEYFDRPQPLVMSFERTWHEFETIRVDRRIQSFDDQVTTTVKALLDSPAERDFVQRYFSHVLVDEYQDLNAAQLALVDIVSRPERNLFVVGDDDQLIYGWRYAKLETILEFEQRHPAPTTYVLETNYRSAAAVVDASRRLISHNRVRVPKDIRAREDARLGLVQYVSDESAQARNDAVTGFVLSARDRAQHWRDVAVLCRFKAQQPMAALALDRAGIPRSSLLHYRLFSDRDMRLLRTYLRLIASPDDISGEDVATALNRPNKYATRDLLDELRQAPDGWATFTDLLDAEKAEGFSWNKLREFHEQVERLHERYRSKQPAARALIDRAAGDFGLEPYWRDAGASRLSSADDARPLALLDLIRLHADDYDSAPKFLQLWQRRIEEEDERADMDDDLLSREAPADDDRVVIGTIHASKGREYEAVVIYDYGLDLADLKEGQFEEERRVFYVGMTRAHSELLITVDANKPVHQFIGESIAIEGAGEEQALNRSDVELYAEGRRAAVKLDRARERVLEVHDGSELLRLERQRVSAGERVDKLDQELGKLVEHLEGRRIWRRLWDDLSRETTRLRAEADALRENLHDAQEALLTTEDDLRLLMADLQRYVEPIEREAGEAETRLRRSDDQRRAVKQRLDELALLGIRSGV